MSACLTALDADILSRVLGVIFDEEIGVFTVIVEQATTAICETGF
jgi:hypothetical protein